MVTATKSKKSSTKGKATAAKKATKGKAAKKATKATSAKKGERETVRIRALKALASGKELTAKAIQEAIGLGHGLKPTMDQEVERGHLEANVYEANAKQGVSAGTYYQITAAGKKALKDGTVNPTRNSK